MTRIDDAKQALQRLGNLDRELADELATMSSDDIVALGQRLWWIVKRCTKALDPIKIYLREQAGTVAGSHRIASVDGSHCIVTVPNSVPILRKDADMAQCQLVLGEDFGKCFEEFVSYKPKKDIQEQVVTLTANKAAMVLSVLDMSDATPKVAFKD